jgi:RNA-directed DNA polymerase
LASTLSNWHSLFSDDRPFLADARLAIEDYLATLRLTIHPIKSQLFETRYGSNFVGFRVLLSGSIWPKKVCIRVRNRNLQRARRRLRQLQQDYATGTLSLSDLIQRLRSWEAHLLHGDTCRLRRDIFDQLIFKPPPEPLPLKNLVGDDVWEEI